MQNEVSGLIGDDMHHDYVQDLWIYALLRRLAKGERLFAKVTAEDRERWDNLSTPEKGDELDSRILQAMEIMSVYCAIREQAERMEALQVEESLITEHLEGLEELKSQEAERLQDLMNEEYEKKKVR